MTSTATVRMVETENMTVILEAYDENNQQIDEEGDTSPDSSLKLSVEANEDIISYLELVVFIPSPPPAGDQRGWADLTRISVQ